MPTAGIQLLSPAPVSHSPGSSRALPRWSQGTGQFIQHQDRCGTTEPQNPACSSFKATRKCLFGRTRRSQPLNQAQIKLRHTRSLAVLSLSLPRFARLSSAAQARNFPWRHPRSEFIPDPCDVTGLQRPRGFCRSWEALTCVGNLLLADTRMSYKKFLPALPPAAFRIFPWGFFR